MGMLNRVCRPGWLASETQNFLRPLLEKSPAVLREAKRALREAFGTEREATLERIERRYLGSLMSLEDAGEGASARSWRSAEPRFKNR